jgi:hypothetical protein
MGQKMINLLSDDCPDNYYLAKLLLCQSGAWNDFGELEQGDQIEIISFEADIFEIKIVAKFGDQVQTFRLKLKNRNSKIYENFKN